jgi:predicted O-linked N-acetylglucosamine transferase (SPINDLY family)
MYYNINQMMATAVKQFQDGNLDEAENILKQVLKSQSKNFDALHISGIIKGIKNRHKEALEFFNKCLRINSNNSFLHFNIAKAFSEIGEEEKSLKYHLSATRLNPNHPEGWMSYGKSLASLNRFEDSIVAYNKAIVLDSEYAEAWYNRGNAFTKLREHVKAIDSYDKATNINPNFAGAWYNRGNALSEIKQYEQALASYDKSIAINPNFADAWYNRGNALSENKQYDQAMVSHDQAIGINPNFADAWYNRGNALNELKLYEQALASYDKAIAINPEHVDAWYNRGIALTELKLYKKSLASYDRAIGINPQFANAWCNRGIVLCSICQFQLAEASFREAIRIEPDNLTIRSSWLFNLNYFESLNPADILEEACIYGRKASNKIALKFTEWRHQTEASKLRVGFVSGDFSNHPVGFFIEGLIEHLDLSQFEIYAFPTQPRTDDLTDRIRPFFKEWIPIYEKTHFDAASIIHKKRIDVLIDLSGHTAGTYLPVFSYKPAPVQVSWLGYFATTGLPEMDYFLGDPHLSLASEKNHFIEKVWNLADTWFCLKPPAFNFSISDLPALSNGFLTFGSLCNLSKINDQVLKTWALILNQIPRSKLLLKTKQFGDAEQIEEFYKRSTKFNISADRLLLEAPESREAYFQTYNRIDFVLDTFPYPGGTTSVDALWMGVPVLTLRGDRFLSHLGESIAINSGNVDWIAQNVEDYVRKAVLFSSDLKQLAQLRTILRERVLKSPLFDTSRFANNFGNALWAMYLQGSKKF